MTTFSPPSLGVKLISSLPGPGAMKSVERYWSPKAWRPMTIGLTHPGTGFGIEGMMMDSALEELDVSS